MRPEKLKGARDRFTQLTGKKPRPVEQAGMFLSLIHISEPTRPY